MASNPSSGSRRVPRHQAAQEVEAETEDEDEDDEDYNPQTDSEEPHRDPASEERAAAVDDNVLELEAAPTVVIIEDGDGGGAVSEGEEGEEEDRQEANGGGVGMDKSSLPNCPVCLEMWKSEGPHRVCCIPCGHVYGRSCLERWLRQCSKKIGKCPQCSRKFRKKEIINLYAPLIVVPNDDLEKELLSLREKNESLSLEREQLLEEIRKHKKHSLASESSERRKMACMELPSTGAICKSFFEYSDQRLQSFDRASSENMFLTGDSSCASYPCRRFVLQNEMVIDGARTLGIDASSHILIVSGKAPGVGGEHVLSKISLLAPQEIEKIQLPRDTKAIRDLCILQSGLALLASLGSKLLLFSKTNNNVVLQYDLPAPAWSCSGDNSSPYHLYAGMQNGMLLVFDVRQTAGPVQSMKGLSTHPIHTIHSVLLEDGTRKALTASSVGPCMWEIDGSGDRPSLITPMDDLDICISLAYGTPTADIIASFRPKVDLSNDTLSSQTWGSPSPPISNSGKLGSHVLFKRANGTSFCKDQVCSGYVSKLRMSKSAIICSETGPPLFAYGDESFYGVRIWHLPSFQKYTDLKPHRHPILDLRYAASSTGPGLLGCLSEEKLQLFTSF
ncbi:uncharacterized protein [Typha latifolia]|uniref:uncharacterized protein n=1 Tax=Typha latifolia TaxID=4733 RepID=UPI003C2C764B